MTKETRRNFFKKPKRWIYVSLVWSDVVGWQIGFFFSLLIFGDVNGSLWPFICIIFDESSFVVEQFCCSFIKYSVDIGFVVVINSLFSFWFSLINNCGFVSVSTIDGILNK